MSNKKQTAVEWLVEELRKYGSPIPKQLEEQAHEMESKKLQKYDEMLEMLVAVVLAFEHKGMGKPTSLTELIKEAKEL
jgi:hypothetical protein